MGLSCRTYEKNIYLSLKKTVQVTQTSLFSPKINVPLFQQIQEHETKPDTDPLLILIGRHTLPKSEQLHLDTQYIEVLALLDGLWGRYEGVFIGHRHC